VTINTNNLNPTFFGESLIKNIKIYLQKLFGGENWNTQRKSQTKESHRQTLSHNVHPALNGKLE
jgi:hypothetical protein